MKKNYEGSISISSGANVWPHEMKSAEVLSCYGYSVCFIRKSERDREHSADAFIDNEKWEFKAPTANHTKTIIKNLKDAKYQSDKLLFDSRRMKAVPDDAIIREIKAQLKNVPEIKKLKYISKHGKIIDLK